MGLFNWFLVCLTKRYAQFEGRASRPEFWMFFLANFIISIVLGIVLGVIHLSFVATLYDLAILIPSIAVGVRRLHDIGKSGWWFLIVLIPILGGLYLLFLAAQEGNPGPNAFGSPPETQAQMSV